MNFKRYHTRYDLASYNNTSAQTVRKVLEGYGIPTVRNNSKWCVNDVDVPYVAKCFAFRKKSGLKNSFVKRIPKELLKQLMKIS